MKTIGLALVLVIGWFQSVFGISSPFPSDPLFIAGVQGRPLPNAQVTVTDLVGTPQTVYNDQIGTLYSNVVPPSQILQFFTVRPGEWIVTVTSQGLFKKYYTTTGIGVGPSVLKVSVDRTSELLILSKAATPTLQCAADGSPCQLLFADATIQTAMFDFIMPSFELVFDSGLISWISPFAGTVVWKMDWCTYKVGDSTCVPTGLHTVTLPSTLTTGRTDLNILPGDWSTTWDPSDHVVIFLSRQGTNGQDDLPGDAFFENVRLEWTRL